MLSARNFWRMTRIEKGYTLFELLGVMALLGLTLLLAVPLYRNAEAWWSLWSDAQSMARELRLARQKAMTMNRQCDVYFRPNCNYYEIKQGLKVKKVTLSHGVVVQGSTFPFVEGKGVLSFTALGTPKQGGTVYLKNLRGQRLYVPVTPVTGRVRVTRTDPGQP